MDIATDQARRFWYAVEPLHALAYFAPETADGWRAVGLRGFWMGYFASRCAPMGPVGPEVVTATYYNFHPAMVRRALPDAWTYAEPQDVLRTWRATAAAALERMLGGPPESAVVDLARAACEELNCDGRPLAAAWVSVPWTGEAAADLWLATTILREHRGDGHVAALVGEEVDGCAAHVLAIAAGANTRAAIQPNRGWSDEDWLGAEDRLRDRGWLDAAGGLTAAGHQARERIEAHTNALALGPLRALGADRAEALIVGLQPLTEVVWRTEGVPHANPIGLPPPQVR